MSSIRELRLVSNLRANLDDRTAIQESFQEIITDLNTIKASWNEALYPVIGSLPQGRRSIVRADRNLLIDPEVNGLDGSQVYMDMTSRVGELGGLLHNGERPKTIKEVVLEVHQSLAAKVNLVEQLLNSVSAGAGSDYDDTELRAWIRQLAGNTWDVDEDTIGDPFAAGNFTGDPNKSITTSLWQRILNTRHLIGVEGLALTQQDVSSLFAATNYLTADTDIVDALITLDAAVFAGGGAVDLQTAYDNSAAGKEIDTSIANEPVRITTLGTNYATLDLRGGILWEAMDGGWTSSLFQQAIAVTNGASDYNFEMRFHTVDPTDPDLEIFRFGANVGAGVTTEQAFLHLGRLSTTTADQLFLMELGREPTADGGEPHLTLESYESSGTKTRITTPLQLGIISGGTTTITAPTLTSVIAGTTTHNSSIFNVNAASANVNTTGGILIDAGGSLQLNTDDNLTFEAKEDGTDPSHVTSLISTSGDYHDLGIITTGTESSIYINSFISILSASDTLMLNSEGTSGWEFQGTNDAWTNGIIFRHMTSIKTDMSADGVADDDEIGKIFYHVDGFANDKWQSAAFDQSQSVLEIGAVKVNGNAPFIVWSEIDGGAGTDIDATYGSSIGAIPLSGFPNIDAVYKENILKSKGVFTVDPSLAASAPHPAVRLPL